MPKPTKITPDNIEQQLDLKAHQHNGYGFRDLHKMLGAGANPSSIARIFNVNRDTMIKYIGIYKQWRIKVKQERAEHDAVLDAIEKF